VTQLFSFVGRFRPALQGLRSLALYGALWSMGAAGTVFAGDFFPPVLPMDGITPPRSLAAASVIRQEPAGPDRSPRQPGRLLALYRPAFVAANLINDLTGRVEDLGIPLADVYSTGDAVYARNVWDFYSFAGKIFIGGGNSSNLGPATNAGPVPRRVYDLQAGRFTDEGQVDEEQIDIFRELSGRLVVPGHDPRQSWRLGNYYTRTANGAWSKFRNIPVALHNYDMAEDKGSLYAALGIDGGGALLRTGENGGPWQQIHQDHHRFYSFLRVNATLFGTSIFVSNSTRPPEEEGGGLVEISVDRAIPRFDLNIANLFPDTNFPGKRVVKLVRPLEAGPQGVYIGAYVHNDHQFLPFGVYVAASLDREKVRVRRLLLPEDALPWDVTVEGENLYVLVAGRDEKPGWLVRVLKTSLLSEGRPVEVFRFRSPAFARSLVIAEGDFYLGLGCEIGDPLAYSEAELSEDTGRILRVRKELLR
jgi:hypothetical protein